MKRTLFLATLALGSATPAMADLDIQLGGSINGSVPSGSAPWLDAYFKDLGSGVVQLTLTDEMNASLNPGNYVDTWLFNANPAFTTAQLNNLQFTYESGAVASVSVGPGQDGGSQVKAGNFNVLFTFQTSNHGRLGDGSGNYLTSVYDISETGLTASDFAFSSTKGFESAAELRSINSNGGSGSVGATPAPEPVSAGLLGAAGLGLFLRKSRRVRTQATS